MPYDPHSTDEEDAGPAVPDAARRFTEFECPECNANNPYDDGFKHGDEITCHYCGQEYRVRVNDEGKLRLKPL